LGWQQLHSSTSSRIQTLDSAQVSSLGAEKKIITARFYVLTAVLLKMQVLWDVVLCHWASISWHSEDHSVFIFMVKRS